MRLRGIALAAIALLESGTAAIAACSVNGTGMSISPATASAGTYTPPTTPAVQTVLITLNGTYTTNSGGGTCRVDLSFQRASIPATMAISGGGGATLPYSLMSAASGGSSLLFTGSNPSNASALRYSFSAGGGNLTNAPFSTTFSVYLSMQPGSPQTGGTYSDNLTAWIFDGNTNNPIFSRAFTVTGVVNSSCTIGGVVRPTADSVTIPVSSAGAVSTSTINRSYANVACASPANLQITSQNGAARNSTAAPTGFTNLINYTVTATFSGAVATLNTATVATASGTEASTAVATSGSAPSGALSVAIVPQANASRLIVGSYTDVISITITPQ